MWRLRAEWVLPIEGPPIENGEVILSGDSIQEVRPATPAGTDNVRDFGCAVIMPGLVNAHTHLEYTVMRGLLENLAFIEWIRALTDRKAALDLEDWISSATWGAAEAVAGGVTTIGDCTDSGAAVWGARSLGLGGIIYQEVFGIDDTRAAEEIVRDLDSKCVDLREAAGGADLSVAVSPHSPYTVRPDVFREVIEYARRDHMRVCIHAAESQAEAELVRSGSGEIADRFVERRIAWQPRGASTVRYLQGLGLLDRQTLLVHGVQVAATDRRAIMESQVSWVHCPKSNAKLGVGIAPLSILCGMVDAGSGASCTGAARVALGSDSVASNNGMDLFEEMRFAVLAQRGTRRRWDALEARTVVEMATVNGARALGMDDRVGTLAPGKRANLCAVRLDGLHTTPAFDPYSALVYSARASDVALTVIGGEAAYDAACGQQIADRFPNVDLEIHRAGVTAAARKLRAWRSTEQ